MKIIKLIILVFSLSLSIPIYAQAKDILHNENKAANNFYNSNLTTLNQTFGIEKLDFQKKVPTLVLYNKTTNFYDTYLYIGSDYTYINSNVIFKNRSNIFIDLFLGNDFFMESNSLMPNTSFILDEDARYPVRDSFNPYGASNISEALLGGVLGLLFN